MLVCLIWRKKYRMFEIEESNYINAKLKIPKINKVNIIIRNGMIYFFIISKKY